MGFLNEPIQNVLFGPSRQIDKINVQVAISENATDQLEITQHPVQVGAAITDHSFKKPTTLIMACSWRGNATSLLSNPLKPIYQSLLDLQNQRIPFDITTPKRKYVNMLFSSLGMTTDKQTENVLSIQATFQQIIWVNYSTVTADRGNLVSAASNQSTQAGGNVSLIQQGVNLFK